MVRYNYLWSHQAAAGRDQGKDRPACLVAVSDSRADPRFLVILPITHSTPTGDTVGIEIPTQVRVALGLDAEPCWVIVSEHNVDEWPNGGQQPLPGRPGVFSYGFIPPSLFARIKARFLELAGRRRSVGYGVDGGAKPPDRLFPAAMEAPTAAPQDAIVVEHLTKRYDATLAVDDISFAVAAGGTVGLLGGNGAGKTTTIALLLGILLPTAGTIRVLGHDMARDRFAALARMNFSSPYVALPQKLSVAENLRVYGHLYDVARIEHRIAELARELELGEFLDRPAGQLSAGQKTRVALAKALINRPAVLLLDEPTASLDPDTGDWVRGWLERYRAESGCTILLASHNMAEVERLCDDVLMLKRGRIVDRGSPADLLARYGRDDLVEVFLDIARDRRHAAELIT